MKNFGFKKDGEEHKLTFNNGSFISFNKNNVVIFINECGYSGKTYFKNINSNTFLLLNWSGEAIYHNNYIKCSPIDNSLEEKSNLAFVLSVLSLNDDNKSNTEDYIKATKRINCILNFIRLNLIKMNRENIKF